MGNNTMTTTRGRRRDHRQRWYSSPTFGGDLPPRSGVVRAKRQTKHKADEEEREIRTFSCVLCEKGPKKRRLEKTFDAF